MAQKIVRGYSWSHLLPKHSEYRSQLYWNVIKDYIDENDIVLDVNCGYSPLAKYMIDDVQKYIGFDKNIKSIEYLSNTYPKGEWRVSDYNNEYIEGITVLLLVGIGGYLNFDEYMRNMVRINRPKIVFTETYFGKIDDKCKQYYRNICKYLARNGYVKKIEKKEDVKIPKNSIRKYCVWIEKDIVLKGSSDQYEKMNDEPYSYGEGMYDRRNKRAAKLLEHVENIDEMKIFEFACSYGWLAKGILEKFDNVKEYKCTNFSPKVIDFVNKQFADDNNDDRVSIELFDVRDTHKTDLTNYNIFICTSLEHIKYDKEFIQFLPKDSYLLFCVPNFDSAGHFRFFEDKQEVIDRYKDLLEFKKRYIIRQNKVLKFICLTKVK
jgi:2-polyprenyl-3-methyl-5-hydroxy-6-metoxy-1,4-benzoquinol methylase